VPSPPSSAPGSPVQAANITGINQTGTVGQALVEPLAFQVLDAFGTPVAGVAVTWRVGSGGGSFSPATTSTDAKGFTQTTWTLGTTPGQDVGGAYYGGVSGLSYGVTYSAEAVTGPPSQLAFTVQPPAGTAGNTLAPSIQVAVEDQYGNVVTSPSFNVSLALNGGTAGATLDGTTTLSSTFLNPPEFPGVAVFWNLSVDTAGTAYRLSATSAGLATASSNPFDITPATTSQWIAQSGTLLMTRQIAVAAVGPDGRIYVAGDAGPSASFEAYDPVTGSSTALADLPVARIFFALASGSNGLVYAIGGRDSSDNTISRVDAYDTSTNTWAQVADLPAPDDSLCAASGGDGRLYAINGSAGAGVVAYDPTTNTWSNGGVMGQLGTIYDGAAAEAPDGNILVVGGSDTPANLGEASVIGWVYLYAMGTPALYTPAFVLQGGLPPTVSLGATFGPDGKLYATGGATEYATSAALAVVETFEVTGPPLTPGGLPQSVVAQAPTLHHARQQCAAVTVPDGRIFVLGGVDPADTALSSIEAYGPVFTLTPTHGSPGTTINVNGSNFAQSASVTVYMGSTAGTVLATGTTDATGTISPQISFPIPSGTANGSYSIVVEDATSSYPVNQTLSVP
jgi:hypothetical protein